VKEALGWMYAGGHISAMDGAEKNWELSKPTNDIAPESTLLEYCCQTTEGKRVQSCDTGLLY